MSSVDEIQAVATMLKGFNITILALALIGAIGLLFLGGFGETAPDWLLMGSGIGLGLVSSLSYFVIDLFRLHVSAVHSGE